MSHVTSEPLDAGVVAITLDRPERRNALTPEMLRTLVQHVQNPEPGARALLVRGRGDAFCAGFDLALCRDDAESVALRALLTELSEAVRAMRACPVPVVLCAHGAAVAGGCAMLGGADIVVTDRAAKLGYPVLPLGISPAVSAPFLAQSVGAGGARRRLLHPRLFRGEEAYRIGLAHELADTAETANAASERLACALAEKPTRGVLATKRWLNELNPPRAGDALDASLALVGNAEERRLLPLAWQR